ncbi:MAG: hypothetical protein Q7S74_04775 [Nanoarchaeota archaeon]|nr:hypothetical protein [Nanoarchaeota archaeon]
MTTKRTEGMVERIFTRHTPHRSIGRRNYARITIWAGTNLGHQVWLETIGGEKGKISERMSNHEENYQHLVGQNIIYNLKTNRYTGDQCGFIRHE